jgi:hypothetical protein
MRSQLLRRFFIAKLYYRGANIAESFLPINFGDIGHPLWTEGLYRRKFFAKKFRQIRRYWASDIAPLYRKCYEMLCVHAKSDRCLWNPRLVLYCSSHYKTLLFLLELLLKVCRAGFQKGWIPADFSSPSRFFLSRFTYPGDEMAG